MKTKRCIQNNNHLLVYLDQPLTTNGAFLLFPKLWLYSFRFCYGLSNDQVYQILQLHRHCEVNIKKKKHIVTFFIFCRYQLNSSFSIYVLDKQIIQDRYAQNNLPVSLIIEAEIIHVASYV